MTTNVVLDAAVVGVLAGRVLARSCEASVIAAFERSFYLDLGDALIAVCCSSLHDGPLTVRLSRPFTARDVRPGQCWTASSCRLERDDGLAIDLTAARIWAPDPPKNPPHPARLRRGLQHLLDLLETRDLPEDSLIGLIVADRQVRNAVERAAVVPIDALRDDLPRRLAERAVGPPPVAGLIGLGPGLTPSGDDLLGGVLITLRYLGEIEVAKALAAAIAAAPPMATNRISQSHLEAAAQGYAAAPLHDLLHATLITGERSPRRTLDAVAEIGHSSGFDALAGMVLAATAWLQAGKVLKTA